MTDASFIARALDALAACPPVQPRLTLRPHPGQVTLELFDEDARLACVSRTPPAAAGLVLDLTLAVRRAGEAVPS